MSAVSNDRKNPFTSAVSYRPMDTELKVVAQFAELPGLYGIRVQDSIEIGSITVTENVTGGAEWSIVNQTPTSSGQVQIAYSLGLLLFHIDDDGLSFNIDYNGGGSIDSLENHLLLTGPATGGPRSNEDWIDSGHPLADATGTEGVFLTFKNWIDNKLPSITPTAINPSIVRIFSPNDTSTVGFTGVINKGHVYIVGNNGNQIDAHLDITTSDPVGIQEIIMMNCNIDHQGGGLLTINALQFTSCDLDITGTGAQVDMETVGITSSTVDVTGAGSSFVMEDATTSLSTITQNGGAFVRILGGIHSGTTFDTDAGLIIISGGAICLDCTFDTGTTGADQILLLGVASVNAGGGGAKFKGGSGLHLVIGGSFTGGEVEDLSTCSVNFDGTFVNGMNVNNQPAGEHAFFNCRVGPGTLTFGATFVGTVSRYFTRVESFLDQSAGGLSWGETLSNDLDDGLALGVGDPDNHHSKLQVEGGSVSFHIEELTASNGMFDRHTVLADASSGAVALTLPPAATFKGREYYIKKTDSDFSKPVSLVGVGGDLIDGVATHYLTQPGEAILIKSTGVAGAKAWAVFGETKRSNLASLTDSSAVVRRFHRTITLPAASAATPVVLIRDEEVTPTEQVNVEGWTIRNLGATWAALLATSLLIETTDALVQFITLDPRIDIGASEQIHNFVKGIQSASSAFAGSMTGNMVPGTAGKGLHAKVDINPGGAPGDLIVDVWGAIK